MLKDKFNRGFTIVELILSIVVIGILAAVVYNTYTTVQIQARDGKRLSTFQALHKSIESYALTHDSYPSDDQLTCTNGGTQLYVGSGYSHVTDPAVFAATQLGVSKTDFYAINSEIAVKFWANAQGKCATYTSFYGLPECTMLGPNRVSFNYDTSNSRWDTGIQYCAVKKDADSTAGGTHKGASGSWVYGYSPCMAGDEGKCRAYELAVSIEKGGAGGCPLGSVRQNWGANNTGALCAYLNGS